MVPDAPAVLGGNRNRLAKSRGGGIWLPDAGAAGIGRPVNGLMTVGELVPEAGEVVVEAVEVVDDEEAGGGRNMKGPIMDANMALKSGAGGADAIEAEDEPEAAEEEREAVETEAELDAVELPGALSVEAADDVADVPEDEPEDDVVLAGAVFIGIPVPIINGGKNGIGGIEG